MQRAAAMDRDLSYLKALHRQYRAIDICLRHKVTRELMLVDLARVSEFAAPPSTPSQSESAPLFSLRSV